tara:strand:+ start:993 stop:2030 length:1038 start_codon:yes stop_codon:yes gene_type:complete
VGNIKKNRMPQVKEPILRTLIKEALKEAELEVGQDNTKFNIKILVSNPQSETKQGIRVQLKPSAGFLEPEKKDELSAAIMTKFNNSLEQFNLQISSDTDTQDPEAMGFFIPLEHIKSMIKKALGVKTQDDDESSMGMPSSKPPSRPAGPPKPPTDIPDDEEEITEQEDPLDRAANLAKQPLPGYMSDMTGLGLKRSQYDQEKGGKLSLKDLHDTAITVQDGMLTLWKEIVGESDYPFKEYLENNEDQYTRTGAVIAMIVEELEDRLELEEPVGPDQGINELKKVIKTQLNEMRVRDLKEISGVVIKEDFYNFINAGQNVLRTLEEQAPHLNGKKYLEYLVKHNIM